MKRPAAILCCAVGLLLFGAALPSPAVFAAGCALAIAWTGAAISVARGAPTVVVSSRVPIREAQERSSIAVFLSCRRAGWWPVRVEALVEGAWHEIGRGELRVDVPIGSRGPHELALIEVRVADPLHLVERRIGSWTLGRVLALPRPQGDRAVVPDLARWLEDGDLEPSGLRSYVAGAPLTRIHWPSLARRGVLLQRDYQPSDADESPLVVVDTHAAVHREAVDEAARTATALVMRLGPTVGCRVLLPGEKTPVRVAADMQAWPELHRRLALLEPPASRSAPRRRATPAIVVRARDRRGLDTPAPRSTDGELAVCDAA